MGKVDIKYLRKELAPSINSLANLAYGAALSKFNSSKSELLDDVKNHEVSKEIAQGNAADGKFFSDGNMFSLLGFQDGDKPVDELLYFIEDSVKLKRKPYIKVDGSRVTYSFEVESPTEKDIIKSTPTAWDSSKSWVKEVEDGVSGFAFYIYYKFFKTPISRSKSGLQNKKSTIRDDSLGGIDYVLKIVENFRNKFK